VIAGPLECGLQLRFDIHEQIPDSEGADVRITSWRECDIGLDVGRAENELFPL